MTEHGSEICRFSHSFSVGFTFPCWKISGLEHFLLEVISKEIVSINLWIYTCSGIIQETGYSFFVLQNVAVAMQQPKIS